MECWEVCYTYYKIRGGWVGVCVGGGGGGGLAHTHIYMDEWMDG